MSRIPDYDEMRRMLAKQEAENMGVNDIENLLYYGYDGYECESNEDILEIFVTMFDSHKIPKIDFNQEALKNEDKRIERGDPR